jgi:hypothetical protein
MGSGGNEHYERVSQIFSAVRATSNLLGNGEVDGTLREDDYACYDDAIDSTPVTIQAGDVLGACVFNPDNEPGDNRRQLDIVGDTGPGGSSLLEMNDDGCTTKTLPPNIPSNQLSNRNNRRLYLFATIGINF